METTKKEEVLTRVQRDSDGKYNLINAQGKLLFDKWFDWIGYFYDEFALVERKNHEYNYIDKQGKIISSEWFKWLDFFHDGLARVQRFDDTMNFINEEGKLLSEEWFRYADYFDNDGLAVVQRTNGEWAKIDKTGKIS